MSTRWEVQDAVFGSHLKPQQRLIMCALLSLTESKTAVIPADHTPSLSRLEAMTGLARSTVAKELNTLENESWVVRQRPSVAAARAKKERTRYRLTVPPTSPHHGPELVRHTDQSASPHHGLASPPHGPELVRVTDVSSPHHGLKSDPYQSSSSSAGARAQIAVALKVEEEEAERIFNRILSERSVGAPSRYVRRLIETGDIEQFRKTPPSAPTYMGARCEFTDSGDGTQLCATCHMPAAHARHGGQS